MQTVESVLEKFYGSLSDEQKESILWKMSPPDSVAPSGPTLKTRMYWRGEGAVWFPVSAMYSRVSIIPPLEFKKFHFEGYVPRVGGRETAVVSFCSTFQMGGGS